ncbi:uncharacterized protein LOC108981767 isoform X2 [Juglans regia]|uniref:Uncharacterized protein LOC108981767 isoform X2 n=1 Tax=Juglans regia TaxID=51240 RepID=A0A6P9EDD1_JUGRE|nr:uncharacterized protein LOC108981767 isoform X2 [Juglans regia]
MRWWKPFCALQILNLASPPWRLEEENAEFFKSYCVRVKLNKQIQLFNDLLEKQSELMNSSSPQSGIHCMPVNNPPLGYPILQQPSISFISQYPSYFVDRMPSCQAVHRIPSPGNFNPTQLCRRYSTFHSYLFYQVGESFKFCINGILWPSSLHFISDGRTWNGNTRLNATNNLHVENVEGLQLVSDGQNGPPKELQSLMQISWNSSVSDIAAGWQNLQDVGTPGNLFGRHHFTF